VTKTPTLEARYDSYSRQCAALGMPPQPFEDWKAYWLVFAKDGELPAGTFTLGSNRNVCTYNGAKR
jgi:hypothetical protein